MQITFQDFTADHTEAVSKMRNMNDMTVGELEYMLSQNTKAWVALDDGVPVAAIAATINNSWVEVFCLACEYGHENTTLRYMIGEYLIPLAKKQSLANRHTDIDVWDNFYAVSSILHDAGFWVKSLQKTKQGSAYRMRYPDPEPMRKVDFNVKSRISDAKGA